MKHRDTMLDLIRVLSALLVMLGHLRGFIFEDFADLKYANSLAKIFYFATGLGNHAVTVFFVLSGYFVGGSVLSGLGKGNFTWRGYLTARLTRLWVVLLPALLLTLGFDMLGLHWNPAAYAGSLQERFMSGPTAAVPAAHDWVTFIGNLSFVQTVNVPVYGTNGPLWSLASEFWYYIMFPLVATAVARFSELHGRIQAVLQMLLFALLVIWLPSGLILSGLIWLLGVGVWWLTHRQEVSDHGERAKVVRVRWYRATSWRLAGGLFFFGTLAVSKAGHWLGNGYAVGLAFAAWMLSLTGDWRFPPWLNRCVTGLSEISYTLYVVHFPVLFLVVSVALNGRQFPADLQGFIWFSGLAGAVLVLSAGMWWLFERNTDQVRNWVLSCRK